MCEYCQYRALLLAAAISARKNPQLLTHIAMYLQITTQPFTAFLYLTNIYQMYPFELFITSAHHLHTYYPSMYRYTIAGIAFIYNILGQAHVCSALTKLCYGHMKVRIDIFYIDIVHAY